MTLNHTNQQGETPRAPQDALSYLETSLLDANLVPSNTGCSAGVHSGRLMTSLLWLAYLVRITKIIPFEKNQFALAGS